jgi:spore germination protein KC
LKRTIVMLITVLILCIFLSGCWGQKEINRLSIVMASAIDLAEETDNIDFTVQIANPAQAASIEGGGGRGGGQEAFLMVTGSGKTLGEAERDLYNRLPRLLYWNNMQGIIISAAFARKKLDAIIDYLDRPTVFRRDMFMVVTPGKAKEVLAVKSLTEKMSGLTIDNIQKLAFKHCKTVYPSDIHDFLLDLSADGVEPILARLEIISPSSQNKDQKKKKQNKTGNAGQQEMLQLLGSAIFQNTKMVGWLNGVETRGALWVWGEMRLGMLTFKYPDSKSKGKLVSVLNQTSSCKIKLDIKDGKPQITVNIEAEGRFSGINFKTDTTITTPKMMAKCDKLYSKAIETEVKRTVAITQKKEYASDIFGFGEVIARSQPKLWRKLKPHWHEEFCKLEVKVKAEAHIRRIGLTLGSSKPL